MEEIGQRSNAGSTETPVLHHSGNPPTGEPQQPVAKETSGHNGDDPMLGFLTLLAKVERPACANCESKDLSPMFYCNTCGQAICAVCKQNTHSAKMFSRHDVTSVSPYSKEPQRKCTVHQEVCIMFSPANESLLCINCFRDLPPDIRAQCLDLDTAYQQKCERLQRGLKAVAELEVTIKDEASTYRSLMKDLHINAMREESTIHVFSKILQGVITATEEKLIDGVKSELQTKEMVFEEKLKTLESLQSNVQAYLTLSTAFIGSASKFDLLKLANGLVERLTDIGNIVHPAKISPENSTISSNFKSEFGQSLKDLLHQEAWNHLVDVDAIAPKQEPASPKPGAGKENAPPDVVKVVDPAVAVKRPPFVGRSQSLLNIPINLDRNALEMKDPKAEAVSVQQQQQHHHHQTTHRRRNRTNADVKFQSLPHKETQRKAAAVVASRSKSVEAKLTSSAHHHQYQQPYHGVSQVELFATIQSRQARHNKNLTVTSALVGLRADQTAQQQKTLSDQTPQPSSDNSARSLPAAGHLCVVQAMVHQDASSGHNESESTRASRQQKKSWEEPLYEPLVGPVGRRSAGNSTGEPSIELTADQVRQLIHAISAAQASSWAAAAGLDNQHVPERDGSAKYPPMPRSLRRNDSFEGHEEAVKMLVDAVREIQHVCVTQTGEQQQ